MNKVAIVTGSGTGIGAAMARRLAEEGGAVVLGDRDEPAAVTVCSEIVAAGGKARAFKVDIRDPEQVEALLAFTRGEFGSAHILINNAGMSAQKHFLDTPLKMLHTMLDVKRAFSPGKRYQWTADSPPRVCSSRICRT